jgi:adenylyltransferase/sulfurtransferase
MKMGEQNMPQQMLPRELAKLIANDHPVHLLDVRQQEEHHFAALPGSTLIPLNELPARTTELTMPKDTLIVVYCHHGMRSLSGAGILQRAGFTNVVSLAGGIDAWSREVDPEVPRY